MSIKRHMSDTAAHWSRRFFFSPDFLIPVFLFVISVLIFRQTNLDMLIQKDFYTQASGWFLKDFPLFKFVYHYGNIPALLIAISGIVLLGMSFRAYKWAKWRKIGLFLLLAMLLGPGLIINAVLKDNWGRPRPRNTIEFGGKYHYEKVLSIDKSSPGHSFPCGHASMGFYLFIPWFVLRKRKNLLANVSLLTGIFYGMLVGIARVAQGGHWFSDVIISGIIVYLTGTILFYMLRLDKSLWFYPKHEEINRKQRNVVGFVLGIMLFFLILGVALATPYSAGKPTGYAYYDYGSGEILDISVNLEQADFSFVPADTVFFDYEAQGFGFPGSKLQIIRKEVSSADTCKIEYGQTVKGFFTELTNTVKGYFPLSQNTRLRLNLEKGSAHLVLPDELHNVSLDIVINKGNLTLDLPSAFKPRITMKGDFELTDKTGFHDADSIFIKEDFRVNLIVRKGKLILR